MAMICLLKIALGRGASGQVVTHLVERLFVGSPAEIQLAAVAAADWEEVLVRG